MILRDALGNGIGHTEVIDTDTDTPKITRSDTPTAYLPSKGMTEIQAWGAMLWTIAFES